MPAYSAIPLPGMSETDEERRRREEGEASLRATEESARLYAAQQASMPPEPPMVAPPAPPPPPDTNALAIPKLDKPIPMPGSSQRAPDVHLNRPTGGGPVRAAAPPPAQGGPTITQRGPGGTSIEMPLGSSDIDQSTSRGSKSTSKRGVSKAEREAEADLTGVRFDQVNNAEQQKQNLIDAAKADQVKQDALQVVAAAKEKDTNDRLAGYEAEIKRREAIANQTEAEYKAQLQDFQQTDPKKRFWAKQDTTEKVTAGLSMLLGIVGGLNDGSNVGAERILKAIDADTARAKDVLEAKERMVERTRGDVTTAKDDISRHKSLIDLRSAVAKERVVAEAEQRAARLGIPKAEVEGNAGMLLIRESAANDRLKLEKDRAAQVNYEQSWSRVTTNANGGLGPNGKPLASEAADRVGLLNGGLDNLNRLESIIKENPNAWNEYRANMANWKQAEAADKIPGAKQLRAAGQATGMVNVSPDQGLKSLAAKEIHRLNEELKSALAKARGGAITAADADAIEREQAMLSTTPKEFLGSIQRSREKFNRNKAIIMGGRPDPYAPPPPSSVVPPEPAQGGARRGKVNGAPAMIFPDGTYTLLGQ